MPINTGEPIVIRKVANGYMVEPLGLPHSGPLLTQVMVFNDMGYASGAGNSGGDPCLLRFIDEHFQPPLGKSGDGRG